MHPIIDLMFENEQPKSVFEVGCSASTFLLEFSTERNVIVGGLDIDNSNYKTSIDRLPKYKDNFYLHDACKVPWPIPSKTYDIVFTVGTLLLIPDPFPVIKEMMRLAKHKIILAEFDDDELDVYGFYGKVPQPIPWKEMRIARSYRKVFQELNISCEIIPGILGKTFIKCSV